METVHFTNAIVPASRPMMRELRILKREINKIWLHIAAKWLPYVLNKYADSLSRRLPRKDLHVIKWLRRSLMASSAVTEDTFRFLPVGEAPYFVRYNTMKEFRII